MAFIQYANSKWLSNHKYVDIILTTLAEPRALYRQTEQLYNASPYTRWYCQRFNTKDDGTKDSGEIGQEIEQLTGFGFDIESGIWRCGHLEVFWGFGRSLGKRAKGDFLAWVVTSSELCLS